MIDADGIDALSMRKLGQALNRDPMRLYSHAQSKAALLDAVAEMVLEEFVIPEVADGAWEDALRSAAHAFRRIALDHPRMVPLLVTRPMTMPLDLLAPSGLRWLDDLLALLVTAGFDAAGASHAHRFYTGFLAGHLLHEFQEMVDRPVTEHPVLQLGGVPAQEAVPRNEDAPAPPGVNARYNGGIELVLGLDIVLTGLRTRLDAANDTTEPNDTIEPNDTTESNTSVLYRNERPHS